MILRLSDSLSRGLIVAAALCVAAVLSFFSLRMAFAANAAEEGTAEGLRLAVRREPLNAEYWYRFGHFRQFNLAETDPGQAKEFFKKAIAIDPQYTDAWLELGTAYELEGNSEEARDAYIHAKKSYPASAEVSWRYGNFLLRQGQPELAYPEFRRSLETDPGRAASAFSRCFRADANLEEILDKILPPIPSAYVEIIKETADSKQVAVAQVVWKRLLTLHPKLILADFQPLVGALMGEGDTVEARLVWDQGTEAMYLPSLSGLKDSVVWDPSFESGINGGIFSWHFQPLTQGLTTSFDTSEKLSGNQSLRLTFDGKHNSNVDAACTSVLVSPNTSYHFSAWVKTKDITTDHGIGFHITSYGETDAPLITSREIYGTNPWTLIDLPYVTGPHVHSALVCISRERNLDTEEKISGTAWVDNVNLVPRAMEPSSQ